MEIYVESDSKLTLHGLQQYYVKLKPEEKNRKLADLLDQLEFNQVVIFVSKVVRARELDRLLKECNFPSIVIHAGLKQEERIARFKSFKVRWWSNTFLVLCFPRMFRPRPLGNTAPIWRVVSRTPSLSSPCV